MPRQRLPARWQWLFLGKAGAVPAAGQLHVNITGQPVRHSHRYTVVLGNLAKAPTTGSVAAYFSVSQSAHSSAYGFWHGSLGSVVWVVSVRWGRVLYPSNGARITPSGTLVEVPLPGGWGYMPHTAHHVCGLPSTVAFSGSAHGRESVNSSSAFHTARHCPKSAR